MTMLELVVRPLRPENHRQMRPLLNRAMDTVAYSAHFDELAIYSQLFADVPPTMYEVRWHRHLLLGAWYHETLLGFIDLATGFDHELLHLAGEEPWGLLRFMALPQDDDIQAQPIGRKLLQAAEGFWQEARVPRVRAFSRSTGYPGFQAGAGFLPDCWPHHFQALLASGYRFHARYTCLHRPLHTVLEEVLPAVALSLVYRGCAADRHYCLYDHTQRVGFARVVGMVVDTPVNVNPVAYLADLRVHDEWRGKGIGKWLLRRLINDLTLQRYQRLVVHLHPTSHAAFYLLGQHGFEELDHRGYVFEKRQ